jgi:hypothetical protein
MKQPTGTPKFDDQPAIAKWELWTLAQMLVSTHGDGAENHAAMRLDEARHSGDEAAEIVWTGVVTQLKRIRESAN